jgi:hypothetical protein
MRKGGVMRRWFWATVFASVSGLVVGGAEGTSTQPTSEGHPHKWLAVEKSLADFVADGFELRTVVYDVSRNRIEVRPGCALFPAEGHDTRALRLSEARSSVYLLVLSGGRTKDAVMGEV